MEDEIDLREVFLVLWRGKWIIIGLVIAAAFAATIGGRMLLTPSYDAVATLLIMPPTYQSAIEPETLALEIYRDLALTPSVATQVIAELQLVNSKGELLTADEILRKVTVEISAPETESETRVGILKVKASWSDPDTARDIANQWVSVFMDNTSHIRKSESDEVARVILNQFGATEAALKKAEQELLEFRSVNTIPLVSQQVELLRSQLKERRQHVLQTQKNLDMKRYQLETIRAQLEPLERDGEWIGLLTWTDAELSNSNHPLAKRVNGAVQRLRQSQNALRNFDDTAMISLVQQELEMEQARLSNYKDKLASLEAELPTIEERMAALRVTLEQQADRLTVNRSLSTDALWQAVANENSLQDLANLRLVDEVINPIYQSLEKSYVDARIELATIPQQMEIYRSLVNDYTKRVETLESRLRELRLERQSLQDQVELSRQLYESLRSQYVSLKQSEAALELEIRRLEGELQLALVEVGEWEAKVASAERELLNLQLEQDWLVRDVDALKRTYSALSDRAENARLAELQATGDVRFVSPAVAPRLPSGPNHKLNVVIAAMLGGMIGLGVVFIRNMLKEPMTSRRTTSGAAEQWLG